MDVTGGLFVTGTDTGVGKTWISVGLLERLAAVGRRAAGVKPVASGCRMTAAGLRNEDAELLHRYSSVHLDYGAVNPLAFEPPIAPHIASEAAGQRIDIEALRRHVAALRQRVDWVVVEGIGGWEVPLNDTQSTADLAVALGLPVVLVVGLRLGCLNHALLTAHAIRQRGLQLAGWVANTVSPEFACLHENVRALQSRIDAPMLGLVPHLTRCDPARIGAALALPFSF